MRFAGKYSKFKPMDGFGTLLASQGVPSGMAGLPPEGIPLEALRGTSSPEALRQEGLQQGPPRLPGGVGSPLGGPIGGGVPGFGPMTLERRTPIYTTDLDIGVDYRNNYGTKVGAKYNPTTGAISGDATIPIGAAENGYRIGVEGSYSPGIMQSDGLTPPPGYSGMLRFSKRNPIDPRAFEQPGAEKYSIEAGFVGTPRRVPPRTPIPVQFVPPGL